MKRRGRARRPSAAGAPRLLPGISLCMIVRNEERFLAGALASVRGEVDEICIVDTGSTDGTIAVAESFGARVATVAWRDDFSWARNQALALARHAWIFVLDADEELVPASVTALRALRATPPDGRGRWIRCRNLGDAGAGAMSNAIVRIFPNDPAVRYRGAIHEYVIRDGAEHALEALPTTIELIHFGYQPEVVVERDKGTRNLRVSRSAYEAAPDDPAQVYNYAAALQLVGDYAASRPLLERACAMTEATPRGFRPQAFGMLAADQLRTGEPAAALATAERCIGFAPTFPDAHFLRGRALAALGRADAARTAFGDAIRAGRHAGTQFVVDDEIAIWKAANEIAISLMAENRHAEAAEWLDEALRARPAAQPLVHNRARCREALGDVQGAYVNLAAALAAYRDQPSAIEYVNLVLRHGGPDRVLAAIEEALPYAGEDYRRTFLLSGAAAMLRAGRRSETQALVNRALAIGDLAVGIALVRELGPHFGVPELESFLPGRDVPGGRAIQGGPT